MWVIGPEMVLPFWVTLVGTAVPMYDGTVSTGSELLPGLVLQELPQLGGVEDVVEANPLNALRAAPVDRLLSVDHCELQKVTVTGQLDQYQQ